ncbi:sprouty-related protein with EVH-1 domain isoform X2 [Lycorma delicatula]|uniref:sprouty-related protein with EVH-1 domain isoform X2 n=1 Tax=Lycorma delicatula TaxID=130591 RepID=UPI003F5189D7
MTEAFEDGNYLVRVRAQVMTRDDSTGGWVPMGGGGLSNVSVRKRNIHPPDTDTKHEYLIFGKRISDQSVVLSCVIKKDFEYYKVMPTFHHWRTGDKKFGLTFQTAADARAFDKGVRTAVEELLDGLAVTLPPHHKPAQHPDDVGDDDVFMTLNLPVERGDSRSSSDSSSGRHNAPPAPVPDSETYSYVQLTAIHDYMYPVVEDSKGEPGSLKKPSQQSILPTKRKEQCRHCQETYSSDTNVRGACQYAPDPIKEGIERVACLACARGVLYHCSSDGEEGDFNRHPCDCGPGCGRRWLCLALLSLVVPCLWCYPPLRACHWCCVMCGLCGGKHRPAS